MMPREVLSQCRWYFLYMLFFSFLIRVLHLATAIYMLVIFDTVVPSKSNPTLFVISAIFLYAIIIQTILEYLQDRLFRQLGETIYVRMRRAVFDTIMRFSNQGEVQKHAMDDLEIFKSFIAGQGMQTLISIPWIPLFLFVLWAFHFALFLVCLITAAILFSLTMIEEITLSGNQAESNKKLRESRDLMANIVKNSEVIGAMSMHDNVLKRWASVNDEYQERSRSAMRKAGIVMGISSFVKNALHIVSMTVAAYLIINIQGMTLGVMIASNILMSKAIGPILGVLGAWRGFLNFREAYRRLEDLLKDRQGAQEGLKLAPPEGHLSVESLLFFLDRERTILNGVNFQLEAGQTLGVIGSSASGKSSLARLMVGIFKPCDGTVRLDGADVHHWSQNGLGEYIGYLPQEQQLFSGTVAENIARMGDANSKVAEVVDAAKRAGAHEMILRLPKGYDTEIGPTGGKLSGGQRQLIALARALCGRPKFIVLDEPNTYLDGQSELMLLAALRTLKAEGVTVVIVSHKPSLLQDADKILVLGQGKQVMFGPREEVMRKLGHVSGVVAPTNDIHAIASGIAA